MAPVEKVQLSQRVHDNVDEIVRFGVVHDEVHKGGWPRGIRTGTISGSRFGHSRQQIPGTVPPPRHRQLTLKTTFHFVNLVENGTASNYSADFVVNNSVSPISRIPCQHGYRHQEAALRPFLGDVDIRFLRYYLAPLT